MRTEKEEQELSEILGELQEQGWEPLKCETAVPYYDVPVNCGDPTAVGTVPEEPMMFPSALLAMQPEFVVTVMGDSMKDANIAKGDKVKVTVEQSFHDGDIVLASIDGDYTLKTYCEDDEGTIWLVPQNDSYEAFPLSEKQNVRLIGVVKELIKMAPRISYKSCMKLVNRVKAELHRQKVTSPEQVNETIRRIEPKVKTVRQWYAVYRAMVDKGVIVENDYASFCIRVADAVPRCARLPYKSELQRMAVDSFKKPVAMWRDGNAPVGGTRFYEYLQIANEMLDLLDEE